MKKSKPEEVFFRFQITIPKSMRKRMGDEAWGKLLNHLGEAVAVSLNGLNERDRKRFSKALEAAIVTPRVAGGE